MENRNNKSDPFYFKRSRINKLFTEAVKHPLVLVSAGAGYGKTSTVLDFAREYKATTVWIQLSERDNVGARFWENCANTIFKLNPALAKTAVKLGFPDTSEKLKQFMALVSEHVKMSPRIIVLDDFHFIRDPAVINFLEECVLYKIPPGTAVFLLSRTSPEINIANLISKGLVFDINEDNLRFTDNELVKYFHHLKLFPPQENIREIMQDTEGWAFAINLIARSYQKAPGYSGYVRTAMKSNIFRLMETEIWDGISEPLQNFLVRLSLIQHLSIDLIALLAEKNESLILEFENQSAYIRRDNYINAYLIHPLFLEFLTAKQDLLTEKQKKETYSIAGAWCNENGFKIDSLSYFEKIEDYETIVTILFAYPDQIPYDMAKYAAAILDRAPESAFDKVLLLATVHVAVYISQGLWEKSIELAKHYEAKFLKMQKNNSLSNQELDALYYIWGCLRILMCTKDDVYDFDQYFEKINKISSLPVDKSKFYNHCPGPWLNYAGHSRKGAPQDFIDSYARTNAAMSKLLNVTNTGQDELVNGELKYYQGDIQVSESLIIRALEYAKESGYFEIIHRSLFYILRISVAQGNYKKADQVIKDIKTYLGENEYLNRFLNHDITICWYYCILGMPEKAPNWLTENFSPYSHASFTENYANQMKALYCYTTKHYPPLLSYIQEMKSRESYLFGRIEMLAMEACIYYKMKDRQKAAAILKEAYDESEPNEILIPFIELGKDMRTLTSFILKKKDYDIPKTWLENINKKSASYAKRIAHVISEYKKANSISGITISQREKEVLSDLSHGLSRTEIASNRNLSINTVKMVINSLYMKLGAGNLADAIRIATEKKIV